MMMRTMWLPTAKIYYCSVDHLKCSRMFSPNNDMKFMCKNMTKFHKQMLLSISLLVCKNTSSRVVLDYVDLRSYEFCNEKKN